MGPRWPDARAPNCAGSPGSTRTGCMPGPNRKRCCPRRSLRYARRSRTTGDEVIGAHLVAAAALTRGHVVVLGAGDHPVLASTPAAHVAALTGRPVHVVAPTTARGPGAVRAGGSGAAAARPDGRVGAPGEGSGGAPPRVRGGRDLRGVHRPDLRRSPGSAGAGRRRSGSARAGHRDRPRRHRRAARPVPGAAAPGHRLGRGLPHPGRDRRGRPLPPVRAVVPDLPAPPSRTSSPFTAWTWSR